MGQCNNESHKPGRSHLAHIIVQVMFKNYDYSHTLVDTARTPNLRFGPCRRNAGLLFAQHFNQRQRWPDECFFMCVIELELGVCIIVCSTQLRSWSLPFGKRFTLSELVLGRTQMKLPKCEAKFEDLSCAFTVRQWAHLLWLAMLHACCVLAFLIVGRNGCLQSTSEIVSTELVLWFPGIRIWPCVDSLKTKFLFVQVTQVFEKKNLGTWSSF